jgi:transcriptional regulator with XRE-family HTH domain
VATKLSNQLLKRVGKRLAGARKAQEMTQDALARAASMDRSYVAGVERGEFNVSLLALAKIARALGVKLKTLLGDD